MNDKPTANMVLNVDGTTFRYAGAMQFPRDKDEQKRVGMIASTNKSITGRSTKPSR